MTTECVKCGSSKMIPDVRIFDQGQGSDGSLQVLIAEEPQALIFRKNKYTALRAQICGECGHTELTVEDPGMLYQAYLKSIEGGG